MKPIVIVDYGMGNLGSVLNMLKRVGAPAIVSGERRDIEDAGKLILPGVGAFGEAMDRINASGLREGLDRKAKEGRTPILGICLGMQLLTRGSEEGGTPGLGWIAGEARRIPSDGSLKVPHMGWNAVRPTRASDLIRGLETEARFYFVHSYSVAVDRPEDTLLKTTYGQEFDSAIQSGSIYGAQFHPEKSHRFGKQFLSNFAALPC